MINNAVLVCTKDQYRAVRESVNYFSEEKLQKDVDAILLWFKKQQHLPRINMDRRLVISILISRKGSVEQAKQKIDLMYSIRNIIPEMSSPRDILCVQLQNVLKGCTYVTMPKLNHDLTRVSIMQYKGDIEYFNPIDIVNWVCLLTEYRLVNDCFAGERFIIDFEDLALGHLKKFTPSLVKNSEIYIRKSYGLRVFGIHFVNTSTLMNTLLTIVRAGLSEKLKSRINIHPSFEDLHKVIDKDVLPVDFGGPEKSTSIIKEAWRTELSKDEVRRYAMAQENIKSNESLRIGGKLDDEILGIAGSFKKLDVD